MFNDPAETRSTSDASRAPTLAYARPNMAPRRPRVPWFALAAATIAWVPVFVTILRPASLRFRAVGLVLGGRWAERHALRVTAALCLVLALGMAATVQLAQALPWLVVALAVWGVANTALYPVCQIRVMQSAPQAQALAGTANVSAANAGIALGALLGGWALQTAGPLSTGRVAAGLAMLAAVAALCMARSGRARHAHCA